MKYRSAGFYETMVAASVWALTGTALGLGRIMEKATRNAPYATKTPNAMDPTAAQINIVKFNKSAI